MTPVAWRDLCPPVHSATLVPHTRQDAADTGQGAADTDIVGLDMVHECRRGAHSQSSHMPRSEASGMSAPHLGFLGGVDP